MMKRAHLLVATVTVAALATTGMAPAAMADPKPGAAKSGAAVKSDGRAKPAKNTDIAKIAAQLGVTADRLEAALVAAKMSLGGSTKVTLDAFAAAVAANLRLPVARVKAAVAPLFLNPGRPRPGDKHGEHKKAGEHTKDGKDKKGGKHKKDDPRTSPFASDAAAARLAAALGISRAQAKTTLVALVSAPGGIVPTSKSFRDLAASLGVSAEQLNSALGDLKKSLDNG
ncbi:hypothetical protein AB0L64_34230 [Kribbella sp. NPDC051936]|uniref:hypothetical protein n=1 Tax=Kribbella sp. NPDC051936 TaxID=3154946 RepID=UPI003442D154